ncbi:MAG TPA: DUF5317 domain-containing protein [Firmicutes bacterium]|nr:DUF5317 domain-containing protein [Candidatus Fermentithermobacillaceae bacterium]
MFAVLLLGSVLIGLALGGEISRLGNIPVRGAFWIIGSYCVRYCAQFLSGKVEPTPALSVTVALLCYGTLLLGIRANYRLPGMKAVLAGTLMNLAVVIVNSGRMPVSLERLSPDAVLPEAARLSASLTHQALLPDMRLTFLADVFRWSMPFGKVSVFSVGDVVLAVGAAILVITVMLRGFPPARDDGRIG